MKSRVLALLLSISMLFGSMPVHAAELGVDESSAFINELTKDSDLTETPNTSDVIEETIEGDDAEEENEGNPSENDDSMQDDTASEDEESSDAPDVDDKDAADKVNSDTKDVEENPKNIEEAEEYAAVTSSATVNSAVQDYINSFKSIYPEGSVWSSSYDGGKQCFGFAMLIADKVFGCHPQNTSIRNAANGTVSNGWTCYYVNASNCNNLIVEPGDIIDSPTKATSSHTAMVLSVSGSNITCVQCNLSGNCKVYWTQNFNYNTKNATLAQIYSRFSGYGTIRLWKPSESLKNAVAGKSIVVDTESPKVGSVSVNNENSRLTFSCTVTDNIGVVSAWAIVTYSNSTSQSLSATISGKQIRGEWTSFSSSDKFTITVYAQDAAGNIGANSAYVDNMNNVTITPGNVMIEVGEEVDINVIYNSLYTLKERSFSSWYNGIIKYDASDLHVEVIGLKPGTDILDFDYTASLDTEDIIGAKWILGKVTAIIDVIPNTPEITSIDVENHKYDCIYYTPVDYAETYDLYRLREGIDSDYQVVATFENDGTNSYTIEHPADGSTYYYKITAKAAQTKNSKSELYYPTSNFSNILSSTTSSFIPTNVSAVSNRDNEIDITWDAVEDASGYDIYRYIEESERELLAVLSDSQTSYRDTDVDGGVTYYYDLYAVDIVGEKGDGVTVSCVAKGFHEEKVFYTVDFQSGFDQIQIENEKVEKGKYSSVLSSSVDLMQMEGYEFIGWYTKPDGAGEIYISETQIMSDITLYAYWKENKSEMSGEFWVAPIGDQKYTGKAIKPEIRVYDGDTLLVQGTDYTVSYKNNVKVCDAKTTELSKAPVVIVKGKKNYSDKASMPFSIVAVDVNDNGITVEDMIAGYNGKEQKPVPVIYYNGKKLKNKTDYTISYPESLKNIGQYNIRVIGKGGYSGERIISFTITDKILLSKVKINKIPNQIYDGTIKKPILTVKYGNKTLSEDAEHNGIGDYTVRYSNNRNIGTATVVLTAVDGSDYIGSKTVTFKITGTAISKATATLSGDRTYNGNVIKPRVNLTLKEKNATGSTETKRLIEGIDYTLAYSNNVNVGTAKILIKGKGKYTGTKTVTFKIAPYDLSKLPAKSDFESQQIGFFISINNGKPVAYQKGKTQPPIMVSYSDYVAGEDDSILQTYILTNNDYKIVYKNVSAISASSVNKAQVLITGKGNYKGTITSDNAKFDIIKADLSTITATASDVSYSPKEGAFSKTKVTLYDINGKKLTAGKDYNKNFIYYNITNYVTSEDDTNMQTIASCDIQILDRVDFETELKKAEEGKSNRITLLNNKSDIPSAYQIVCVKINALDTSNCNYGGTAYAFYRISSSNIVKSTVKVKGTFTYNGTQQTLDMDDLTITIGSGKNKQELVYGKDYIIDIGSYTNNIKVGKASVYIYGIGSYYGMKKVTFRIYSKKFLFF